MFPRAARANPSIFYGRKGARSLSQVYASLIAKHNNIQALADAGDGGGHGNDCRHLCSADCCCCQDRSSPRPARRPGSRPRPAHKPPRRFRPPPMPPRAGRCSTACSGAMGGLPLRQWSASCGAPRTCNSRTSSMGEPTRSLRRLRSGKSSGVGRTSARSVPLPAARPCRKARGGPPRSPAAPIMVNALLRRPTPSSLVIPAPGGEAIPPSRTGQRPPA